MRGPWICCALVIVGCSSTDAAPSAPYTCAIGELTGTWRIHYAETNGSCRSAPADETIVLGATQTGAAAQCTYAANNISSDKCSIDNDFTCPTTDSKGSQHWIGSLHQTAADHLTGSMTLQLQHPALGTCRSTYDVTWSKQ